MDAFRICFALLLLHLKFIFLMKTQEKILRKLPGISRIIRLIDKNTNMDKKLKEYYQKSKFKFELENMKYKRQNEK